MKGMERPEGIDVPVSRTTTKIEKGRLEDQCTDLEFASLFQSLAIAVQPGSNDP
jgi:hypothetical protein